MTRLSIRLMDKGLFGIADDLPGGCNQVAKWTAGELLIKHNAYPSVDDDKAGSVYGWGGEG